jgi:hypothetical protein
VLIERKIIVMKLNSVLLVSLVSIGLLIVRAASSYRLAPTPANQVWERNNAQTKYTTQNRQFQVPNVSTGTSGSALQHNGVIRQGVANEQ